MTLLACSREVLLNLRQSPASTLLDPLTLDYTDSTHAVHQPDK